MAIVLGPAWCWRVLCLLMVMVNASAWAQQGVYAPPTAAAPDSHAWVVIPDHPSRPGAGRAVLLHLPPRTGPLAVGPGTVHLVRVFSEPPLAAAAWDDRVFLAFAGTGPGEKPVILIRSQRAVHTGFAWAYVPPDRLEAHPPIDSEAPIESMAAGEGLLAVVLRGQSEADQLRVLVDDNDWEPVPLPFGSTLRLHTWSTSRGILVASTGTTPWRAAILSRSNGQLRWSDVFELAPSPTDAAVFAFERARYVARQEGGSIELALLNGNRSVPIASVSMPERASLAPVWADGPRLLGLWWTRDPEQPTAMPELYSMEVSLGSGALLYKDAVPRSEDISAGEFRLLATFLFALLVAVLVLVLKGDLARDTPTLPKDTALAAPGRRFIAWLIDLLLAAGIAAAIYGVPYVDLISLKVLALPGGLWTAVPATFLVGGVVGFLTEWLFNRSPGKLVTGCFVARIGVGPNDPTRIGFRAALIRNAIKWLVPPVAALAAVESDGRHRGDQIAGTVVVVRVED